MVQKVTKDLTEDLIAEIAELKLTNDDFTNLREEHQQQQIQRDQDLLESSTDLEKVTTKYFGVLLCRLRSVSVDCIICLQRMVHKAPSLQRMVHKWPSLQRMVHTWPSLQRMVHK